VLLDHIIYAAAQTPPSLAVVEALVPHIYSLSKAYLVNSAEFFVAKLNILQKNLTRGLQDPLEPSSKTFPGAPELVFLRALGAIWSTSDMKHAVVGPAKCLMGAYLGLGRVRDLKDIASGLYLCSLLMHVRLLYIPRNPSDRMFDSMKNYRKDLYPKRSTLSYNHSLSFVPLRIPTLDLSQEPSLSPI
jgi:nucleolar protein 14